MIVCELWKVSWQVKPVKGGGPIRKIQFMLYLKQMLDKIKGTIEVLFSAT